MHRRAPFAAGLPAATLLAAGLGLLVAGLLLPSPTDACLHAGPGFEIAQRSFEAFAVVHDGREDLVLKIAYQADQPLASIGMVIPVPNPPDRYRALEPGFFEELRRWVNVDTGTRVRARGLGQRATASVVELEPVRAGPYDIRPIQASGPDAVGAVRAWLEEHGFSTIPEAALAPFADAGWTYLAVRVSPEAEGTLASAAALPPLHLSFVSPAAVFPVRLEAQGVFPMWLYLATPGPLPDDAFDGAVARGFVVARAGSRPELPSTDYFPMTSVHAFEAATTPPPVRDFLDSIGSWDEQSLYLRVLHARRFGEGRADPSTWDGALTIPELPDAALVAQPEPVEPEPLEEETVEEEPAPAEDDPAPIEDPPTAEADPADDPAAPAGSSGCGCRAAPSGVPVGALGLLLAVMLRVGYRRARRVPHRRR